MKLGNIEVSNRRNRLRLRIRLSLVGLTLTPALGSGEGRLSCDYGNNAVLFVILK